MTRSRLAAVVRDAEACRLCAKELPHAPRPVLRVRVTARLLIVGQAPGTRVHASGMPFDDRSGDRLRDWLGIDRTIFYTHPAIAILPMGLCFPGQDARGGDLPPMKICAPTWHPVIRPLMPALELTLLIGQYAQAYFLGERRKKTLTDTVAAWREFAPRYFPLPHPSPRNVGWFKHNPWFDAEVVPALRERVAEVMEQH